jgi:exportin-5
VNDVKDEVEVGRLLGCGVEVALGDYPRPDRGFGEAAEEADREWQEHRINFGLQLIHHVVEHRWDECGEEARAGAKTVAIMLADALAPDPGVLEAVGSRFLLRKVAALFAAIGVREWPQRWPDLIDSLVDRASGDPNGAGGGHVFLACATVRNLVEEVYEFGHTMQGDRRRDLVKSLDEVAPQYLGMLAATLANGVEALRQREHIPTEAVLCEVLDGLKACFDHSPLPPLLEAGFLPLLCEVLHHPTLRQAAADCLLLGVARKGQLADRVPLLALLDNFELVTGAVPSPDPHDAESHTFLKRLCQFVSVLGSNQVCAVWAGQGLTKVR